MKNNSGTIKLDQLDIKILDKLQTDARITNQDLADAVGLSPSPCLQRVKRLEKAGIIASYRVQIDLNAVCRHVDVICAVTLKSHGLEDFAIRAGGAGMQHVFECTKVSGNIDYFVRFICPDIGAYQMMSDERLQLGPRSQSAATSSSRPCGRSPACPRRSGVGVLGGYEIEASCRNRCRIDRPGRGHHLCSRRVRLCAFTIGAGRGGQGMHSPPAPCRHWRMKDAGWPVAGDGRRAVERAQTMTVALRGPATFRRIRLRISRPRSASSSQLDRGAAPDAVLASSTSALLPSRFTESLPGRARCLVVHPIIPLT